MNSTAPLSAPLPRSVSSEEELEELLSRPTPDLVELARRLPGDLLVLGAGGKMGPSLCRMARRAWDEAGNRARVVAVSRFTSPQARRLLDESGVETIACDLFDDEAVRRLPDAPNVVYLVGVKFGTTGNESRTWAANTVVAGQVAQKYRHARLVALSTGNVYPLVPVQSGGCRETDPPGPVGEYAWSCLGRERVFHFYSERYGTPCCLVRLNYAVELRYGVLLDLAQRVWNQQPVDLRMGYVNVIWQGDANRMILRCLEAVETPPAVMNVTGPETLSVRELTLQLGRLLEREPVLEGTEEETALLNNASRAAQRFGPPTVPVETVLQWVADWVRRGGRTLGKPTHFQVRDGRF